MILKDIFKKDINRSIQGVIKVDNDDTNVIKQELEEYVVTGEIERHFNEFYDAYTTSLGTNRTENMAVWISGFFGSGKSHFLKMLAYLLENRNIDGKNAVDYFEPKIKDAMLFGNIKRSGVTTSDVILFNIDTKAGLENTTQKDRILKVLENVFNEKLGYSHINYVADIERYLDENGKYDEFKSKFEEGWENVRNDFDFEQDRIAEAYAEVMNTTTEEANRIFDSRRDNHDISPEKFAERIQKYIEEKGGDHHVIFLIDEIGQYIGDQGSLMLNLQSIVEELGVRTGGKAWVVCTSQEAIDEVVKSERFKRNDFSKILGRFDTKIKLASTDIEEVIKARLLEKTDAAADTLRARYEQDGADIRNSFSFSASTQTQKLYKDTDDFIATYPYIPYQFALVQNTYTYIRTKGFAGAHLSSGARSLLSAVQETAIKNQNAEIGALIPFSAFYDTISTAVDSSVEQIITRAEALAIEGKLNQEDIPILKTLFMLRGSNTLPPTIENITTLELTQLGEDKLELEKRIKASLRRLEDEVFIQKSGDNYNFLTDEEQEINRAIQDENVNPDEVNERIGGIVLGLCEGNKFNYQDKRIFSTDYYLNDRKLTAGNNDICLVFTTSAENAKNQSIINVDQAYIAIEPSDETQDLLRRAIRIEKFQRKNSGIAKSEDRQRIINARVNEMNAMRDKVRADIADYLESAPVYIGGGQIDIPSADPKSRLKLIQSELVKNTFTKLDFIKSKKTTSDARTLLNKSKEEVVTPVNPEATEAVFEFINERAINHYPQTQLSDLISQFAKRPYGFDTDDVVYLVASLTRDGKFSVSKSNSTLSLGELSNALAQSREYDNIYIKIREKVASDLLATAKDVLKNAFERSIPTSNEDEVTEQLRDAIEDAKDTASNLLVRYASSNSFKYPGEDAVKSADKLLRELFQIKDNAELFNTVSEKGAEIIAVMQALAPVKEFFNGSQVKIFDDTVKVMSDYGAQSLLYTIEGDEPAKIREILTNPEPYRSISNLPALTTSLRNKLDEITERLRKAEEERRKQEEEARKQAAEAGTDTPAATVKKHTIRPGDLTTNVKTRTLKSEQDVDKLLSELKSYLMAQLNDNDELEVF
ncbi:MAG: BREX system P-loop protein BrxC [Candidatus Saccharibacteria bacterium]|nr:BREX system P-loop protein BrxC [Candidatus Saccharibacteria bacterium]